MTHVERAVPPRRSNPLSGSPGVKILFRKENRIRGLTVWSNRIWNVVSTKVLGPCSSNNVSTTLICPIQQQDNKITMFEGYSVGSAVKR